jgi:hypothetical protein
MDLFSADRTHILTGHASAEDDKLRVWMHIEARKQLAFGILRADVYTSVLMSSRPLISAEEVELDLPAPDDIWIRPGTIICRPRPRGTRP